MVEGQTEDTNCISKKERKELSLRTVSAAAVACASEWCCCLSHFSPVCVDKATATLLDWAHIRWNMKESEIVNVHKEKKSLCCNIKTKHDF